MTANNNIHMHVNIVNLQI